MTHILHVDGSGSGWSLDHPTACSTEPCPAEKRIAEIVDAFEGLRPGSWVVDTHGEAFTVTPMTGSIDPRC